MTECRIDDPLAALVDGSASDEPLSVWHDHIATCDSCAVRVARREHAATANATVAPAQSVARSDTSDRVSRRVQGRYDRSRCFSHASFERRR